MASIPGKDALIIGIDFGTTYSGVAWSITKDPSNVMVVNSWPGGASENRSAGQVPSVIAYNPKEPHKYKWGFDITSTNANQLAWFKLLLNQSTYNSDCSTTVVSSSSHSLMTQRMQASIAAAKELEAKLRETSARIPAGKEVVDVIADYMTELVNYTNKALENTYPASMINQLGNIIPIHYILTVPAVWSDRAKAMTLQAAKKAGMSGTNSVQKSVRLISEPEAAAMHCLRFYQDTQNCLQVGDIYVVADCGGGTVDLISYEITAIEPRLKVKECVVGSGGMCGSTSLNRRFISFLQDRIGQREWDNIQPRTKLQLENEFDRMKKNFMPADTDDEDEFDDDDNLVFIPLPGVPDNRAKNIERGQLLLTHKEMASIFAPTFDEITDLVLEQIESAQDFTKRKVTGVLLVGGFGESRYLREHLVQQVTKSLGRKIDVLQPANAWSAIVRGAVHDGVALHESGDQLSNGMLESRRARYSYGIGVCTPFLYGLHPIDKRFLHPHYGTFYCSDVMNWFVKKNEELPCGLKIPITLSKTLNEKFKNPELIYTKIVYICDSENPPLLQTDDSVKKLLDFRVDFRKMRHKVKSSQNEHTGQQFKFLNFDNVMNFDSASMNFAVEIDKQRIAVSPTVEYQHVVPSAMERKPLGFEEQLRMLQLGY